MGILEETIAAMPCYAFINKEVWYPAIARMKMNASKTEIGFIERIESMINLYYANIQNISEEASMRSYLTGNVQFNAFCRAWSQKIKGDFKRNIALYAKIFNLVREQIIASISEQHPEYPSLYGDDCTGKYSDLDQQIAALQQLSVIRHYLRANANGQDLHVICYGGKDLQNLTATLAEKVNYEWNINNSNVSEIVSNKIMSEKEPF